MLETNMRREAFQQKIGIGAPVSPNTQDSAQDSENSGVKVLFHPKSHVDELEALKDELNKAQQELRQQTVQLEKNQKNDDDD